MMDMLTGGYYRTWRCANYRKGNPSLGCRALIQFRALPRPQIDSYVVHKLQLVHMDDCDLLTTARQEADAEEAQRTGGKLKRTFSKGKGLYVRTLCQVLSSPCSYPALTPC